MKNTHLWLILVLATSLRITYWVEVKDEAWFVAPGTDPEYYLNWANDILNDNISQYIPFPRAPLYPYIIAGIQKLFGFGWLGLRLFNLICDLWTIVLIYLVGRRIVDHRVGIIAGIIFAVSGAGIYFTGEVLMTSLGTLCLTWIMYSLATASGSKLMSKFISSGIGIGVMALLRPNILILLPFTSLFAYYLCNLQRESVKRLIVPIIHLSSAFIILLPTILVNYQNSGHFIPVSTQGGVNFLIGNVRGADGWSSTLPTAGPSWNNIDALILASGFVRRELSDVEVSPVLWKMGLHEIVSAPMSWLKLMVKKNLLFINFREIANNRPFLLPRETSIIFGILSVVSLGAIFPFSLLGLVRLRNISEVKVLGALSVLYGISIVLFFVTTRYRTPVFPAFAILAAMGFTELLKHRKNEKRIFGLMFILLIGGLLSFPAWGGSDFGDEVQANFIAGNAHLRMNQPMKAMENYKLALIIEPEFYELNLNTGVAWLALGDTNKAEDAFFREISHWQDSPKAYNNLGVIREGQGSVSDAVRYYKRSLTADASFVDARVNLARIFLKRGDVYARTGILDSAALYYKQVLSLKGASAGLLHRMAIIELDNDKLVEAKQYLRHGLTLDPDFTPSLDLLKELRSQE